MDVKKVALKARMIQFRLNFWTMTVDGTVRRW